MTKVFEPERYNAIMKTINNAYNETTRYNAQAAVLQHHIEAYNASCSESHTEYQASHAEFVRLKQQYASEYHSVPSNQRRFIPSLTSITQGYNAVSSINMADFRNIDDEDVRNERQQLPYHLQDLNNVEVSQEQVNEYAIPHEHKIRGKPKSLSLQEQDELQQMYNKAFNDRITAYNKATEALRVAARAALVWERQSSSTCMEKNNARRVDDALTALRGIKQRMGMD
jgi:hypothetical protein